MSLPLYLVAASSLQPLHLLFFLSISPPVIASRCLLLLHLSRLVNLRGEGGCSDEDVTTSDKAIRCCCWRERGEREERIEERKRDGRILPIYSDKFSNLSRENPPINPLYE